MIPIELKEEQKDMLLEMATFFYPELQNRAFNEAVDYYGSKEEAEINVCGFYITGDGHIQCSYPIYDHDDSFHQHLIERIHWFEFCSTALLAKFIAINGDYSILPQYSKHTYQYYINECTSSAVYDSKAMHPVDFLYEIFKKLTIFKS